MQPGRELDVGLGRHLLNRKVRYIGATKPGDIATSPNEYGDLDLSEYHSLADVLADCGQLLLELAMRKTWERRERVR